jgi:hypothetical protein
VFVLLSLEAVPFLRGRASNLTALFKARKS